MILYLLFYPHNTMIPWAPSLLTYIKSCLKMDLVFLARNIWPLCCNTPIQLDCHTGLPTLEQAISRDLVGCGQHPTDYAVESQLGALVAL